MQKRCLWAPGSADLLCGGFCTCGFGGSARQAGGSCPILARWAAIVWQLLRHGDRLNGGRITRQGAVGVGARAAAVPPEVLDGAPLALQTTCTMSSENAARLPSSAIGVPAALLSRCGHAVTHGDIMTLKSLQALTGDSRTCWRLERMRSSAAAGAMWWCLMR